MRAAFPVVLALATLLSLVFAAVPSIPRKSLAGPPEEFQYHAVPDPKKVKLVERSITQNVVLEKNGDAWIETATIPVDGVGQFFFTFASPYAQYITLALTDPQGNAVDLAKAEVKARLQFQRKFHPLGLCLMAPAPSLFFSQAFYFLF